MIDKTRILPFCILLWLACATAAWSQQPARRIVSLAPHITELLFAIGAGPWVVGAVQHSDFPEAARQIPRVGSHERINLEAILALQPDLVVAWPGGGQARYLEKWVQLGVQLGIPLVTSDPKRLTDIPADMRRLGAQVGRLATASAQAEAFERTYQRLKRRFASQSPVRVFYQIWHQPLMTVSGQHVISDVIRLCGGVNVFHALPVLAPTVNLEAVLHANPDAIVASGMDEKRPAWLDAWRRWPHMTAVAHNHLFVIPPDLMQRHTPRILQGAAQLCRHLAGVRRQVLSKRDGSGSNRSDPRSESWGLRPQTPAGGDDPPRTPAIVFLKKSQRDGSGKGRVPSQWGVERSPTIFPNGYLKSVPTGQP